MRFYLTRLYRLIFWSKAKRRSHTTAAWNKAIKDAFKQVTIDNIYRESPILERIRRDH